MKLVRPAVCVATLGALVALAVPSQAAPPAYKGKTLSVADDTGDGNGLNDQGLGLADTSVPAVGYDGYDIVKVDYLGTGTMTKKGRRFIPKCTGFTVSMTFAAAPGPQSIIRVTGSGTVQDALWWIQLEGTEGSIRYGHTDSAEPTGSTDDTVVLSTPVKIDGSTITWTVTENDVKATGETLQKLRINGIGASVRTTTGVVTAPQWDAIPEGDLSFKPC